MAVLGVVPGLPFLPFAPIGGLWPSSASPSPGALRRSALPSGEGRERGASAEEQSRSRSRSSSSRSRSNCASARRSQRRAAARSSDMAQRIAKMRRKFAKPIRLRRSGDPSRGRYSGAAEELSDQDSRHGGRHARTAGRTTLIVVGDGPRPDLPGDEMREPAFGMKALVIPETFVKNAEARRLHAGRDISVLLTHVARSDPQQPCSTLVVPDLRALLDRLEPEYQASCLTKSARRKFRIPAFRAF